MLSLAQLLEEIKITRANLDEKLEVLKSVEEEGRELAYKRDNIDVKLKQLKATIFDITFIKGNGALEEVIKMSEEARALMHSLEEMTIRKAELDKQSVELPPLLEELSYDYNKLRELLIAYIHTGTDPIYLKLVADGGSYVLDGSTKKTYSEMEIVDLYGKWSKEARKLPDRKLVEKENGDQIGQQSQITSGYHTSKSRRYSKPGPKQNNTPKSYPDFAAQQRKIIVGVGLVVIFVAIVVGFHQILMNYL
jgi:hypothetical protein